MPTLPSTGRMGLTIEEYSASRSCDPADVRAAIHAGKLNLFFDGTIDPRGPRIGLTQAQYAAHRARLGLPGATRARVCQAKGEGLLVHHCDGSIDADATDLRWAARANAKHAPAPGASGARPSSPVAAQPTSDRHDDYAAARGKREQAEAEIRRLKADLLRASVVEVAVAEEEMRRVNTIIRASFEALPDLLADVLAAIADPHEVHKILTEKINNCLLSASRDMEAEQ